MNFFLCNLDFVDNLQEKSQFEVIKGAGGIGMALVG